MASFFIRRPVFAWVLAIVTMLAGALGLRTLPISQYPDIAPTTIRISANYTGASAEAVENSVTTTIEEGLTGLEGLLYMTSSSSTGSSRITLVYDDSVDPNMAQVEVQNRLQLITSSLPTTVQERGIRVTRSTSSILMIGALVSPDGRLSTVELGDIAARVIEGPVTRTEGVGDINVFGTGYAMRIWLDPMKLVQYRVTPGDVISAVSAQNTVVSVGSIGSQPVVEGQQLTATITAQSQLSTVAEFERIRLRTDTGGAAVYLGDVARIEIGRESYGRDSFFNGAPAAGFGINLATSANAVETAERVRATFERLAPALPEGVEIRTPYDTSPFVELSIEQVYHTLAEAIVLVFLVILIFLQNWRATLIPTIAVPVVLLGTFGMLAALGYSINTLTMFAMVLAIGLLVDDAIVVVENVERVMREEGLPPREATEKSMGQISGALVGIALVLSAVFLPMAFLGGSTGVIYRQFAVTIISAMMLSLLVALILTPAMCATMLKPHKHGDGPALARWFNRNFERTTDGYTRAVEFLLRWPFAMFGGLAAVSVGIWMLYSELPSSFLPQEDQGVMMVRISLDEGATTAQTASVVEEIRDYLMNEESTVVKSVFGNLGFSFGGSGQNQAMIFVSLKDFAERATPETSVSALVKRATARFGKHRAGRITFMQPPAIPGMGNSAGFSMFLVDQTGQGQQALADTANALAEAATASGRVTQIRGNENALQSALRLDIDQQKAEALGLTLSEVNAMLSIIFAGREVNDFTLGNDLRPVLIQGEAASRMQPEDVEKWYARNNSGEMVPFASIMTQKWVEVPPNLARFGATRALEITGTPAAGFSSGDAMDAMESATADLPGGYTAAWTGISYQERLSGNQAPYLYALAALAVFLCLAALYESWTVPFSVMLAVPAGLLGALIAALLFGQSNDVYFKVGLLTTIGLAAKNAILIVEFAQAQKRAGAGLIDATVTASRQRLRPILMTSFAFMLGVVPLATAAGAGAGAQKAIGIGVLGGMFAATLLGIFMVPSFYVAVMRIFGRR